MVQIIKRQIRYFDPGGNVFRRSETKYTVKEDGQPLFDAEGLELRHIKTRLVVRGYREAELVSLRVRISGHNVY